MSPRAPSEPPSPERNAPSVEAAYQAAPEEMVAEILDGELHLSPRPATPHAVTATRLGVLLGAPFWLGQGGPGGWFFLDEAEFHFGPRPDRIVPDLAGWRRERMPDVLGTEPPAEYYALTPDWVCEVLSPSTRERDQGPKQRIYAREGIQHLWHIDPLARTLEVFRLQGAEWNRVARFTGEERVRAEPFEAIELELALLWSR